MSSAVRRVTLPLAFFSAGLVVVATVVVVVDDVDDVAVDVKTEADEAVELGAVVAANVVTDADEVESLGGRIVLDVGVDWVACARPKLKAGAEDAAGGAKVMGRVVCA